MPCSPGGGPSSGRLPESCELAPVEADADLDRDLPDRRGARDKNAKESKAVMDGLADGTVDIVVGTHKLLQGSTRFTNLGLAIIDEEHRFGVRHTPN